MIVLVDSREQLPYRFPEATETRRVALRVGDYSLQGLQEDVAIERKTLADLLGSITSGRERFIKELRQLRAYRFAALVIETDWPTIEMKAYPQNIAPTAVMGSLMSFAIRYGVIPVLAGDRAMAETITWRLLHNFARMVERDAKALRGEAAR